MSGSNHLAPALHGLGRTHGRIGLLGGSFNPAHDGHFHISKEALKRLNLDAVWWLVSPQNPLKSSDGMAPFEARFRSAQKMAQHPRIHPSDLEVVLKTRYTADTIAKLRMRFPSVHFVWLMGADNMIQLPRWDRWEYIVESIPIAVFGRPTYSLKAMTGKVAYRYDRRRVPIEASKQLADLSPPAWVFLTIRLNPVSATELRVNGQAEKLLGGSEQ